MSEYFIVSDEMNGRISGDGTGLSPKRVCKKRAGLAATAPEGKDS